MGAAFDIFTFYQVSGTSLNLIDGTNYAVVDGGWSLQVADDRRSPLGGRTPYEDVDEEITLNIMGSSAAAVLTNIVALRQLIRRADQFERFGEGTPVMLDLRMAGGTQVTARVLGGSLELPTNYNDMLVVNEVSSAVLRLRRQGAWLSTSVVSVTSSSTVNGAVATIATGSTPQVPSPTKVSINGIATNTAFGTGVLVVYGASSHVNAQDLQTFTGATSAPFASVADATAQGGSFTRFTAASAGATGILDGLPFLPPDGSRFAAFITAANTSPTYSATFQLEINTRGTYNYTTPVVLPPNSTQKNTLFLGTFVTPASLSNLRLMVTGEGAGMTVDMDRLMTVCLDDPNTAVIGHYSSPSPANMASTSAMAFDHRLLTDPSPRVYIIDGSSNIGPVSYQGDPVIVTANATFFVLWFATGVSSWRVTTAGTASSHTFTAIRNNAYLVPQ